MDCPACKRNRGTKMIELKTTETKLYVTLGVKLKIKAYSSDFLIEKKDNCKEIKLPSKA